MKSRWLLAAFFAVIMALPGAAAPELYVRNRLVKGAVAQGGEYYVPMADLERLFTAEERARITEEGGQILVDGQPVGQGPPVPLVAVARALGFEVRPQKALGMIDLVPPGAKDRQKGAPPGMKPGREHGLARQRMNQVLAMFPRVNDPKVQERVEKVGRKIVEATERPWVEWEFMVVAGQPNAATTGEGTMFVTDALMRLGLSDDELAGVIGHEVAHGIARHPFRGDDMAAEIDGLYRDMVAFQKEWTTRPRGIGGSSEGWRAAERQRYENRVAEFRKRIESLSERLNNSEFYEQTEEEEADMDGMRYAATAGYDPMGLMRALARLEGNRIVLFGYGFTQVTHGTPMPTGIQRPAFKESRTHPPTVRRIEILRRVYESWRR